MKKLRPLIKNQSIRIDNHNPGKPITWDWSEDEQPDDVHLDKSMTKKVNGKFVKIRVTLNNDQGANEQPKKCEREDVEWMKAYDRMMKEVHETLETNKVVRDQLIEDVNNAVSEIGAKKVKRAVRKALKRIADHFDLSANLFLQFKEVNRGTVALYWDENDSQQYYVGFGMDYAFYLGEGDGGVFSRRVRGWRKSIPNKSTKE